MSKSQSVPMGYEPPKISSQVSIRIALAYKAKGEGIRRAWDETAAARGENIDEDGKAVELEIAHVWRTLLEQKVDEEVAKLTGGAGFPALDDEKAWAELRAKIRAGVLKAKSSR